MSWRRSSGILVENSIGGFKRGYSWLLETKSPTDFGSKLWIYIGRSTISSRTFSKCFNSSFGSFHMWIWKHERSFWSECITFSKNSLISIFPPCFSFMMRNLPQFFVVFLAVFVKKWFSIVNLWQTITSWFSYLWMPRLWSRWNLCHVSRMFQCFRTPKSQL